ncbi:MAG: DUF4097 domain-containing protein [Acidobacteriia bacterium]|nr:DUF4097 domain-containing protein [Terriglobia bacterium]
MARFAAPLIAVALLAASSASAADSKSVNRTVALSSTGSVHLDTFKGSVQVTTWDRPEVEINARIEAAGSSATDRSLFDATEIEIDSSGDSLRIATRYLRSCCNDISGTNPGVVYSIRMPRTARLSIHDRRSDLQIRDLSAALDINTHRGATRIERLRGPLYLTTHRGDAHIDFAAFTGASRVETHRGSIQLRLPKDSRFELHAQLDRRSSIESDFPVMAHLSRHSGGDVEGTVNGGGPALRLSTERGRIRVEAQ